MKKFDYKISTLIIQSNSYCNLDCKYCYLDKESRSTYNPVQYQYIEALLDKVLDDGNYLEDMEIVWHAGEPMAVKISEFQSYLDIFSGHPISKNINFRHVIQTNGTHISSEWIELFKKYNVNLAISMDGPEVFHDANRIFRSGKGTFHRIMDGIDKLRKEKVQFGVLSVINSLNVKHPNEMYSFLSNLGAKHIMFNPIRNVGICKEQDESFLEEYKGFFTTMLKLSVQGGNKSLFREFNPKFSKCGRPPFPQEAMPMAYILLTSSGHLSTFSPDLAGAEAAKYNNFIFGHIDDTSISGMYNNKFLQRAFRDIFTGIVNCRDSCEYFSQCGGTKTTSRFYENGDLSSTETTDCINFIKMPLKVLASNCQKV